MPQAGGPPQKDRQYNDEKKKNNMQWSTKHYSENYQLSITNPT
jgi:hypothetical protein